MTKPFTPELRMRPATHLYRAAAAHVHAHSGKISVERAIKALWPDDQVTILVAKAASAPALTSVPAWAGTLAVTVIDDSLQAITTISAAAGLIQRGMKVSLSGSWHVRIPGRLVDANDAGSWLGEGAPIRVRTQRVTSGPTLTPHKLGVITSYTNEMVQTSAIEAVSRALISEAVALKLDATLFGTQADDGITPAGILNGVTPITAAGRVGTAEDAMVDDIKALVAALVAAGAGANPVLITNPAQAVILSLLAGPKFNIPVLQSSSIANGTVIAIEPESFVSAFGVEPEFQTTPHATLMFDDTNPADWGTPIKSTFQTDSIALRMILQAAWGLRATGHVQVITGTNW